MTVSVMALTGFLALAANGELFQALDADQDGIISKQEVAGAQQIWFTRALRVADADSDGTLTASELETALRDPKPRSMSGFGGNQGQRRRMDPRRLDRNSDGVISRDEVPQQLQDRYDQMLDRLGKDSISVEQLDSLMAQYGPQGRDRDVKSIDRMKMKLSEDSDPKGRFRMNERADKNGKGQMAPNRQGGRFGKGAPPIFGRLDRNNDGSIDKSEAPERLKAAFRRLDADNDGKITLQEFSSSGRRFRKQRQK